MATLGRDSFAVPTDDLESDDIVMPSGQGRDGQPVGERLLSRVRADPAVSLVRAGVSTPT